MVKSMTVTLVVFMFMITFCTAVQIYNIVDYQAAGDGITDDSQAIMKAWNAACVDASRPIVYIPPGKKFLIGTATPLQGPCKSPIRVQIDGNITAPNRFWTKDEITLLSFNYVNNLFVYGEGTIDGQGAIWWDCWNNSRCVRPYLLDFNMCHNVGLRYIKLTNAPARHLALYHCSHVRVHGITVTAPKDSPNTDAIVIGGSTKIWITGSTMENGDDCVAMLAGTSNVTIHGVRCGPSHGISIGSLGKDGTTAVVEHVHVKHCSISQSLTGARIKTWQGGSGYVRDVSFENINMTDVVKPIEINQYYFANSSQGPEESAVAISNVRFANIFGTSTQETAVFVECSAVVPCRNMTFDTIILGRDGENRTVSAIVENAYGTIEGISIPPIPMSGN